MDQGFKPQDPRSYGTTGNSAEGERLTHAKMELVAAQDRGEKGALTQLINRYPGYAADLIDLNMALIATSGYERVALTPATESIAARARSRAMAAVFGAASAQAPAAAPAKRTAVVSLRALRQARSLTLKAVSQQLGVGVDVLSSLESGLVRAASVPERFLRALSESLDTTLDQVHDALWSQPSATPALRRGIANPRSAQDPEQDFAEAVRHSPNMTQAQKARWLKDEQ